MAETRLGADTPADRIEGEKVYVVGFRRIGAQLVTFAHAPWSAFWLLTGVLLIADVVRLVVVDGIPRGLGVAPATAVAVTLFLRRVLPRGPG